MNLLREARLFDDPGQIRSFDAAIAHRAGDSETGDFRSGARVSEKLSDDLA